jgi:drug/metabolite transporter (DMT)-like permease
MTRVRLKDLIWIGIGVSSVALLIRDVRRELTSPQVNWALVIGGLLFGVLGGVTTRLLTTKSSARSGDIGFAALMVISLLLALFWEPLADIGNPTMWVVYSSLHLGVRMTARRARSPENTDGG